MNRNDEFIELKDELEQTPIELDYIATKAITQAKKSKRNSTLFKTPLISFCSVVVAFVILVNLFPAVALAMSNVPVLKDLVHAVAFDPSLKEAVSHDYYQVIGESQTQDDVTVTVDYMILDAGHISLFFSVDAPVKAGNWHYDFRDAQGNGLSAAICFNSMYEVDKLEEIKLDFLENNIPEEITFNVTVNKDENFEAGKEEVAADPRDEPTTTGYKEEKTTGKDYNFSFKLTPDKKFLHTVNTIPIDQWIEIMDQKILLKSLDIYPTQARLNIDCDDTNSAALWGLSIYFEDEKGNKYGIENNGFSGAYEPDSQNIATIFCDSSYFADANHLTLYIGGINLIDKDKLYGEINNTSKTISNLPQGVSIDSMSLKDSTLDITLRVVTDKSNTRYGILSMEYYDLEGNNYNMGYMTSETNMEEDLYSYTINFKIPNYEDHKYKVNWNYAPLQTFELPITIKIN